MIGRMLAWVGRYVIALGSYVRDISALSYFCFREIFLTSGRRRRMMVPVFRQQLLVAGVDALPMIAIVALLLGSVMIISLHVVGADDFLGTVMVLVIIRELGPLVTTFVVVGRSGTALSSEIGEMQVGMQMRILQAMGIRVLGFVVLPRMLAMVVATVCLTVYFDVVAVMGGIVIAKFTLGIPLAVFLDTLDRSLALTDVAITVMKGALFGLAVAAISCHHGLSVQQNTAEVSQATIRTIVGAGTVCILLDLLFILSFGISI